jgi:hypothetical protein
VCARYRRKRARALRDQPGTTPYIVDVADEARVAECIARIVERHGASTCVMISIVPGRGGQGGLSRPVTEAKYWHAIFA